MARETCEMRCRLTVLEGIFSDYCMHAMRTWKCVIFPALKWHNTFSCFHLIIAEWSRRCESLHPNEVSHVTSQSRALIFETLYSAYASNICSKKRFKLETDFNGELKLLPGMQADFAPKENEALFGEFIDFVEMREWGCHPFIIIDSLDSTYFRCNVHAAN